MMISVTGGMSGLDLDSPLNASPPCLSYSPCSVDTPSSSTSSPLASLKTAYSSLSTPTSSINEQNLKKRPSFIRRKPVPRLILEDELALLDDEAGRLTDEAPSPPIAGFSLLPALELLARKQSETSVRPLYSVVPDPPSVVMLNKPAKISESVPAPLAIIIATIVYQASTDTADPLSPIPRESPGVSEVAIEWYTTPVAETTHSTRYRIPSDAA